jgi:hypothetical protein
MMRKVDTWLDIQKYMQDAPENIPTPLILSDVEFMARIDPLRSRPERRWFRRLRRA